LERIAQRLEERGGDALAAHEVKRAAMERIFGFEILPAPFEVAHLQLGLLLQNLGVPLSQVRNERVAMYLTSALTGWEAGKPDQARQTILRGYPELLEERDQAREVKRDKPILVILGNPPYNGFAGSAVDEERDLTDAYRVARATKQPQGQGLNDLYVRFFRMAERRIVEQTGKGIVCFISKPNCRSTPSGPVPFGQS
jgi:predicted helicase